MIASVSECPERVSPEREPTLATPSFLVEYGYYFYIFYTMLGGAFGLFINNVGSGLLAILFVVCLQELKFQAFTVLGLVAFPLGCAIAHSLIQLFLHDELLMGDSVRPFVLWMFTLVIVQSLSLRRNFLHRFSVVVFLVGLCALPFLSVTVQTNAYQRVGLDRAVGFAHPNEMAEWFGFCSVYFIVLGIITRRNSVRTLSWLIAVGCLFVVTLAVTRGTLTAVAVAVLVASRHLLKKGFFPILILGCLIWLIVQLPIFDQAMQAYGERGLEETGRFAVWPNIFKRFLDSPLIGVGGSNVGGFTDAGNFITPHNAFLYLAQASGIVPLALFIAYWFRAARATVQKNAKSSPDAAFRVPFLLFIFQAVGGADFSFMMPWGVVALAIALNGADGSPASGVTSTQRRTRETLLHPLA